MSATSVFRAADGRFVASELARGPWDPGAQHGGAPAALLMRAFEGLPAPDGLQISRVTYDFLRPIPLGAVTVEASVVRSGRRVQLLEASLMRADGVEVARARALQVTRATGVEPTAAPPPPPGPPRGIPDKPHSPHRPMFAPDAVELRFVNGRFGAVGPATAWFRLHVPLVEGEEPTPLQRVAVAGDFGNGISAVVSWDDYVFINPDLTLYIERVPAGEWVCVEAHTVIAADGIGLAESVLYDERGRIGRAVQALLVAPKPSV